MVVGVVFDVEFVFEVRLSLSAPKRMFFGLKRVHRCNFRELWDEDMLTC